MGISCVEKRTRWRYQSASPSPVIRSGRAQFASGGARPSQDTCPLRLPENEPEHGLDPVLSSAGFTTDVAAARQLEGERNASANRDNDLIAVLQL